MAVTWNDVENSENQLSAAQAAVEAAQADEAQVAANPEARYDGSLDAARAKTRAAIDRRNQAKQNRDRISNAYNKENPSQRAQTPGAQEDAARKRSENEQRRRNKQEIGLEITDKERYDREQRGAPRPARTDSPVQQAQAQIAATNANTNIRRTAETERKNRATEQRNVIADQRDALYKAGMLYKDVRNQVSQEAQTQYQGEVTLAREGATSARSLLESEDKQLDRMAALRKDRASFVNNVLTTALPQVVDLMLKTPKGSKIPGQFLLAFLTLANEAYETAGLNNEPPPIDKNSPHYQALQRSLGYVGREPPKMPSTGQVGWRTAQSMAVGGIPLPGWQGEIGVGATRYPDMPPGTNGDGVNVLKEAEQSPEGQAIINEARQSIADIERKKAAGEPLTGEERAREEAARRLAKEKIRRLAETKQAVGDTPPPPGSPPGTARPGQDPAATEGQGLKQELRGALISGDPNQKLRIMAAAKAGLANRAAGRPLEPDQLAVLSNLDQEDIDLINQHMTDDVGGILVRYRNGQPPSPDEVVRVQSAITGASSAIKTRPLTPVDAQQTQRSSMLMADPNVVRAQQQEHETNRLERQRIKQENPELDAMMTQVEEEQRQAGRQAAADGSMINFSVRPLREQAEERLRMGERPQSVFYEQPGKLIRSDQEPDQPRLTGPSFMESTEWTGRQEEEEPSIPEIPKLFGGFESIAEAPGYQPDLSELRPSMQFEEPEMPQLLAPIFEREEEEEDRPRSLFDSYTSWGF